jgi:hypothetical protein
MSKLIRFVALFFTVFAAFATNFPTTESVKEDIDQQRQRIDAARKEKMTEFTAQDAACLSRFAVTDCQNKVGVRRREMLTDLRRQEARLNELDRRQKGESQVLRSQHNAFDKAQRQSQSQVTSDGNSPQKGQRGLDEKERNHKIPINARNSPINRTASGMDAASIERNRQLHAEKQRAAEHRRLDREKRVLNRGGGSTPLPETP